MRIYFVVQRIHIDNDNNHDNVCGNLCVMGSKQIIDNCESSQEYYRLQCKQTKSRYHWLDKSRDCNFGMKTIIDPCHTMQTFTVNDSSVMPSKTKWKMIVINIVSSLLVKSPTPESSHNIPKINLNREINMLWACITYSVKICIIMNWHIHNLQIANSGVIPFYKITKHHSIIK